MNTRILCDKQFLEIEETSYTDETLRLCDKAVEQKIRAYCNLPEGDLPPALEDVIVQVTVERFKNGGVIPDPVVNMGDIQFSTKATIDELEPHYPILNRYRRVKIL